MSEHQITLEQLPLRAITAYSVRCAWRVHPLWNLTVQELPPTRSLFGFGKKPDEWEEQKKAVYTAICIADMFATDDLVIERLGTRGQRKMEPLDFAARALPIIDEAEQAAKKAKSANQLRLCAIASAAGAALATAGKAAAVAGGRLEPDAVVKQALIADANADLAIALTGYTDALKLAKAADYRKLLELKLGKYPELGEPVDLSISTPLWPDSGPTWKYDLLIHPF